MPERTKPHSDDAERSVLGSALQSEKALYDVVELLTAADFYRSENAEVFDAVNELYKAGKSVDAVTTADVLKRRKTLDMVGGMEYLFRLTSVVPSPSNAADYAGIIIEKSILRSLIDKSQEVIGQCFDEKGEASEVLSNAEQNILGIATHRQSKDFIAVGKALEDVSEKMKSMKGKKGLTGLSTGFTALDKLTSGFQNSDLIVLAARPGMGKTSFALNVALNAAKKSGKPILVFSLEMSSLQLGERLLSTEASVPLTKIRDGSVFESGSDIEKVQEATEQITASTLYIDDTSGITINEMKNKCRRLKAKTGDLGLVVVDYLQLMDLSGLSRVDARPENRQQEIATLSRMFKQLARDMECPVLLLSQLSRAVEQRGGKKPVLSDLRESGAIEQDADIVIFIYNDESDEEGDSIRHLLIAKHRNGQTGDIKLTWLDRYTKFGNHADTPF